MSTIYTDSFAHSDDVEISLEEPQCGYLGRELCITAKGGQEVRLVLTDKPHAIVRDIEQPDALRVMSYSRAWYDRREIIEVCTPVWGDVA